MHCKTNRDGNVTFRDYPSFSILRYAISDALHALDREREEMRERLEVMDGYSRTLLIMGTVLVIC